MARGINNIGGGGVDQYNPTYTRKVNYKQTLSEGDLFHAKLNYGLLTTSQPPGLNTSFDRCVFDPTETFLATNSGTGGVIEFFRNNLDGTFTSVNKAGVFPDNVNQIAMQYDENGALRVAMQRVSEIRFAIYNGALNQFEIQTEVLTVPIGSFSLRLEFSIDCNFLLHGYSQSGTIAMSAFKRNVDSYSELTYGNSVSNINAVVGVAWSRTRSVCYVLFNDFVLSTYKIARLNFTDTTYDGQEILNLSSNDNVGDLQIDVFNKKMFLSEKIGSFLAMYSLQEGDSISSLTLDQRLEIVSSGNNEPNQNFKSLSRINKDNMIVYLYNANLVTRFQQFIKCVKIYGNQINVIDELLIDTTGNSEAFMATFSENFIVMATASGVKSIPIEMNTTKVVANGLVQVVSPTESNILGVATQDGVDGDYKQVDILMR